MVTLNLFIESPLQIHCIRYQSEGTSLLITCPQLTAEHTPLLDAAAILWLLLWLTLCNSARANTNALRVITYFTSNATSYSIILPCLKLKNFNLPNHVACIKCHYHKNLE